MGARRFEIEFSVKGDKDPVKMFKTALGRKSFCEEHNIFDASELKNITFKGDAPRYFNTDPIGYCKFVDSVSSELNFGDVGIWKTGFVGGSCTPKTVFTLKRLNFEESQSISPIWVKVLRNYGQPTNTTTVLFTPYGTKLLEDTRQNCIKAAETKYLSMLAPGECLYMHTCRGVDYCIYPSVEAPKDATINYIAVGFAPYW